MEVSVVVVSMVSSYLRMTAHKAQNQHVVQVDTALYSLFDFFMTLKTDLVAIKQRNAELSFIVERGACLKF